MKMVTLSEEELAYWLKRAKDAHGEYEAQNGPDKDWPEWYADYIARKVGFDVKGPTH